MKHYDQNKFERNIPKLSETRKAISKIESFNQAELNDWQLSKDQITFWRKEIMEISDKILALLDLKD